MKDQATVVTMLQADSECRSILWGTMELFGLAESGSHGVAERQMHGAVGCGRPVG